jgi:hypothetical protein
LIVDVGLMDGCLLISGSLISCLFSLGLCRSDSGSACLILLSLSRSGVRLRARLDDNKDDDDHRHFGRMVD